MKDKRWVIGLLLAALWLLACGASAVRLPDSQMLCIGGEDGDQWEYVTSVNMKRDAVGWVDMGGDVNISTEPCMVKWNFYHPPPPGSDDTEWRVTCSVGTTVYYDAPVRNLSTGDSKLGSLRWIEQQTGVLYQTTMDCRARVTNP